MLPQIEHELHKIKRKQTRVTEKKLAVFHRAKQILEYTEDVNKFEELKEIYI